MTPHPHPQQRFSTGHLAAFLILAGALAFGWHLLSLRHRTGSAHPPYSSHRADPLGCRVLHDALREIPGLRVERLETSARRLDAPAASVLWVLGGIPSETGSLPESILRGLEEFAHAGGRVIVAISPMPRETWASQRAERRLSSVPPGGTDPSEERTGSMRERWGFAVEFHPLPANDEGLLQPVPAQRHPTASHLALPETLDCHTAVRFTSITNAWNPVYTVEDRPVMLLRAWGAGQICLIADAYPFSNEGMASQPNGDLLAWLVGRRTRIVFNETHLGTLRAGGIARLARHYRLEGFLGGTLAVLVLVVLRLRRPLVPRVAPDSAAATAVSGLGTEAGLSALIQRTIPSSELPRIALEEWQASVGQHHPAWTPVFARLAEVTRTGAAASGPQRDPVATLAELSRIVHPPTTTPSRPRHSPLDLPRP